MPTRRTKNIFSKKNDYRNASIGPSVRYESRRPRTGSTGSRSSYGTHSSRSTRSTRSTRNTGSNDLDFRSSRVNRRATRGEIDHVIPTTHSRESVADFSKRNARRGLYDNVERTSKLKTVLLGAAILAFAALVAFFVGSCTFNNTVNSKMSLQDSDISSVLVEPTEGQPYYVLIAGVYTEGNKNHGSDMLMLARVDEQNKKVTFINVPGNMVVNNNRLCVVQRTSGDDALIQQVSEAVGVDISHYVRIDSENLAKMVDDFGGITMELSEEVDDPDTGDLYLPAGEQTLDGEAALVYLRANNYSGGNETRATYQVAFLKVILEKLLDEDPRTALDSISSCIQTDYTADEAIALMNTFADADAKKFTACSVPGSTANENGVTTFYMSSSSWETMKSKIEEGSDPNEQESVLDSVDTSDYKIEIRNGSGITGAAAEAKSTLKGVGFKVKKVGNTESAAYSETLVIYKKNKNAKAAEAVVEALGKGRTVQNSLYYTFSTDVLVIIGKDWSLDAS